RPTCQLAKWWMGGSRLPPGRRLGEGRENRRATYGFSLTVLRPAGRRERVEGLLGGAQFGFAETHRGEKGLAHFGRLAGLEDVAPQVAAAERVAHDFAAREPLDEVPALGDRQRDGAVDRRIADHRLRVPAVPG